ncbi:MAG: diguanylate cyclase [Clostridia bacterium]|nr:diguanylate cyclase [Clostridia bacterium]
MSNDVSSVLNVLSMVYEHVLSVDKDGNTLMPSNILPEGSSNVLSIVSQPDIAKMEYFLKCDEEKVDGVFAVFSPNLKMKWAKIACLKKAGNIFIGINDYTEKQQSRRKEQHTSQYDMLTNTHYRHNLETALKEIDRPENLPISIIMFDVNGMKLTNEAFGYAEGDALLKKCTIIINSASPVDSKLFRMNGDEFLLLCPLCGENCRQEILGKIEAMCSEETESMIPPSFSIGIAYKESENERATLLIKQAEQNLYANRIVESTKFNASIIQNLKNLLSKKNFETSAHISRVKGLALSLGEELGLNQEQKNTLSVAAEMHDIGKVAIPDEILGKQGPLTDEEWDIVRQHPVTSYRIIYGLGDMYHIAEIVKCHHERYDGTGYPSGLKGEEIPLIARILTLVDSYDNMLNSPYVKRKMTQQDAIDEVKRCTGSQFDPKISDALLNIIKKG